MDQGHHRSARMQHQGRRPADDVGKGSGLRRACAQRTFIHIDEETYTAFGQPEAWRVSVWQGDEMLDEEISFLW